MPAPAEAKRGGLPQAHAARGAHIAGGGRPQRRPSALDRLRVASEHALSFGPTKAASMKAP